MQRRGFTLVELMVAMALTLFVMVILSQAFVTSIGIFEQLKGIGEMQEGLRTAAQHLRSDLDADHFEDGRRLSDPDFIVTLRDNNDLNNVTAEQHGTKPTKGFFAIYQTMATTDEGTDVDGLHSFTTASQSLHFTVRRSGKRPENFFAARLASGGTLPSDNVSWAQANEYHSRWGEVAYFLLKQGTTVNPNDPNSTVGTDLHKLYRAEYPMSEKGETFDGNIANYLEFCALDATASGVAKVKFPSPEEVMDLNKRAMTPGALPTRRSSSGSPPPGASVVLRNVISFHVQVFKRVRNQAGDTFNLPDHFAEVDTAVPSEFDTGTVEDYQIEAVKVTLRVWDQKTEQARQISIIQDM